MKNKLLFVCLGNICRSPMAEGLAKYKVEQKGLKGIEIDSAGTSAYHIGELPDERMCLTASGHGIQLTSRARQFIMSDFDTFDHIIVMDRQNYKDVAALSRNDQDLDKIKLMRYFDDIEKDADVPDPYFGGKEGFENVYDILNRSIEKFLSSII